MSGSQMSRHICTVPPQPRGPPPCLPHISTLLSCSQGDEAASGTQLGGSSEEKAEGLEGQTSSRSEYSSGTTAWVLGQIVFQQTSRTFGMLSPGANLVTTNAAGESRPTAGTREGFCSTKTRVVTAFVITDLACADSRTPSDCPMPPPTRRWGKGHPSPDPVTRGVMVTEATSRTVFNREKWEIKKIT